MIVGKIKFNKSTEETIGSVFKFIAVVAVSICAFMFLIGVGVASLVGLVR